MKKIILCWVMLFLCYSVSGGYVGSTFFDKPLFDFSLENIELPWGKYRLLRSNEKTTQVLLSQSWYSRTLYTDRNNIQDDTIFTIATSTAKPVTELKNITQADFNELVLTILLKGDETDTATYPYAGLEEYYKNAVQGKSKITKTGSLYTISLYDKAGRLRSTLGIDMINNELWFKNTFDDASLDNCIYPVYVSDTSDYTITAIIREYVLKLHKIITENAPKQGGPK